MGEPWFFKKYNKAVTITSKHYFKIVKDFFLSKLEEIDEEDGYFQQDCTVTHTVRISMSLLP